jgi:hypothetical protein
MLKNVKFRTVAAACALFVAGVAAGQAPVVNIGTKHGNLRAAQEFIVNAYGKIDEAQHDNRDQLGGHAEAAKQHLSEADAELREAANYANSHGH